MKKPLQFWRAMRRKLRGARLVGIALLAALVLLRAADPALLDMARATTFDIYQQIKPRISPPDTPIAIVDIDESSLAELGQWPWPRDLLAEMVDRLSASGAVVIGFDVVFAESDRLNGDNDRRFAQAIAAGSVVLGQTALASGGNPPGPIASVAEVGGDPRPFLLDYGGMLRNLPILDMAAAGRGVFTVNREADGVVRRVPALLRTGEAIYPSLALEMLRVATGNASYAARVDPDLGIQGVVIRPNLVRTDAQGRVWLYASHRDETKYVSARDILSADFDPARVAGKLVLVGTSAAGLNDIRATALEPYIPGVELHAQILESILFDQQLTRPNHSLALELIALALGGLLLIVIVPAVRARWTMAIFLGLSAALVSASWWAFAQHRLLYDPVFPVIASLLLYMQISYANYARAEEQRRQVRGAFGRYLSPALVERLAAYPDQLRLGGEIREMTMLFCDIRGFTAISERLGAQGLTRLINRFLTPMTAVILRSGGTIDKYMGDCVMAFWNAPMDDAAHAAHACQAALAMAAELGPLNASLAVEAAREGREHLPLSIGIGLNTGEACVGNMGSDQRFDYSVLGDSVNLASRLESQSKSYGVTIVIGESTQAAAPDFAAIELDLIRVSGKSAAARIFALIGDAGTTTRDDFAALSETHSAMLAAYRGQDWDLAEALLSRNRHLAENFGLGQVYALYGERIDRYRAAAPGAGWDGVFNALTK